MAAARRPLKDVKYAGGWDRLALIAADHGRNEVAGTTAVGIRSLPWPSDAVRAAAEAALNCGGSRRAIGIRAVVVAARASSPRTSVCRTTDSPAHDAHFVPARRCWRSSNRFETHTRLTTMRPSRWPTSSPRSAAGSRARRSRHVPARAASCCCDAASAGYADIDDLRLVGLVDADWPGTGRRSIFYPAPFLGQLGWSAEADEAGGRTRAFSRSLAAAAAFGPRSRPSRSKTTRLCRRRVS